MIICHCAVVSDEEIRAAAQRESRLGRICQDTGAGQRCGGCIPSVRKMLEDLLFHRDSLSLTYATEEKYEAPEPARRRAA
ncbi:BFD-like [2Fe-2S] binding domain-containing protein [Austwickia chelonae]|uniref:(2Fe-2S)-binding protein n=1 Tax=Austwickia chelonae TaxID=100225 RepID=UPI0008ACA4B8|nr:BFD-like [2Fe-2S] binding domain-containing protein [Austwickia chelonae]